jgi:UDP-N-acetylglucosamine diphosphorylase/glucosamine-1-phosphate N-acetyltransferase
MNIILFDSPIHRKNLLPLAFTRPIADFRIGILTIAEKWGKLYNTTKISYQTESYLSEKFPTHLTDDNYWINGALLPDNLIIESIYQLNINNALVKDGVLLAYRGEHFIPNMVSEFPYQVKLINKLWDIFLHNGEEIKKDYDLITAGRKSTGTDDIFTAIYGNELFVEEGADIKAAVINTETGPVYIGKNAQIKPGTVIEGPFALCHHARVNMGAKIRGNTTVGPYSTVGGELNNAVIFANSNKGHEGYLGNAVLGEWVNLGADTNNSNVKNNFSSVRVWNYKSESYEDSERSNCGIFIGDHAKAGINTMFNTGTVVGVGANIFGGGFPPKYIPNFSWGTSDELFELDKLDEMAEKWMKTKGKEYNKVEQKILHYIYFSNTLK